MTSTAPSGLAERLALTESLFQAVFDQSPTGIYVLDTQLRITQVNDQATALIGHRADTIGQTLSDILHRLWAPEAAEAALLPFRSVLENGHPFKAAAYQTTRRGSNEHLFFDWEVRRITLSNGVVAGLLVTFVDVTEHVLLRDQARNAEQRIHELAESVPQLVWSTDASGKFSYANQRWTDYTGLDLAASRVTDWRSVVHPDDYDQVMTLWARVFAQGDPYQIEFRMRRASDGEYRWHLVRARPRRGKDSVITQWDGTSTDIHDLKTAAEDLAIADKRWQVLAACMPQKIFTATPAGDVDYFNPQWMEYTGLTFEEIRDWGWKQFIHPEDVEENVRVWQRSLDTGEPFQFENRFRRGDGVYRWHLSRAHPVRDAAGAITQWIGSNTDIDDQKRSAEALARSNADLENFAAVASHDLKEPLRMVSNYLELVEKRYGEKLDARGHDYLRHATGGARRMHQLIDAVMAYSKVSSPGAVMPAVDAGLVLDETLADLHSYIESRQAAVERGPLLSVVVDPIQLGRVFQNLIVNAIKFTGDRPPVVHIGAVAVGKLAVFTVTDNGLGIQPTDLKSIFHMFSRCHVEDVPGAGIGLATCRKIVENHGGSIWVESEMGVGSKFSFALPLSGRQASSAPRVS
ncbi:MAG: PAS domain S-box protein [Planctomycetes bacterium]|nr:PAS domain S-box protein [Planctomycetota bacterium]